MLERPRAGEEDIQVQAEAEAAAAPVADVPGEAEAEGDSRGAAEEQERRRLGLNAGLAAFVADIPIARHQEREGRAQTENSAVLRAPVPEEVAPAPLQEEPAVARIAVAPVRGGARTQGNVRGRE